MKQNRKPQIPQVNLQQDATATKSTSTGSAFSDVEPSDDCSTTTADDTTAVRSSTLTTTSLSSIVATKTGGPRPPPGSPHHPGAEFSEALRLAGRRKVLRAPGELLLLRSRPFSEAARVPKRRIAALVKRQWKECNSNLLSWHKVSSRWHRLTGSSESERLQRQPREYQSASTESDGSADALRKQLKMPLRPKSPEAAWSHLQAAVQAIVSELSQQGKLPKDPALQLTEADLREAIELLLQKRDTVLKQTRPEPVVTGQREIEMDASGDGPFRLTVCIPRNLFCSPRSKTLSKTAPTSDMSAENAVINVQDLDAGIALPEVKLYRDISFGNAAATAAAAVVQAAVLEKCTKAEPHAAGLIKRCSIDQDLINSLHRELAEQFKLGSETKKPVMRDNLKSLPSSAGQPRSLQQHTTSEDLLLVLGDEEANQDGSTLSSTLRINETASTILKQQDGYADSEEPQKPNDEDAEDHERERQALFERRKEMREHLRRVSAPLVSCPASVVDHLAGHTEQAELAKFLLDRMRPAASLGRSALDVRNRWMVLQLSQPPLRRNQYHRSSSAGPEVQSQQSSASGI